jgi:hypothetical protein
MVASLVVDCKQDVTGRQRWRHPVMSGASGEPDAKSFTRLGRSN